MKEKLEADLYRKVMKSKTFHSTEENRKHYQNKMTSVNMGE